MVRTIGFTLHAPFGLGGIQFTDEISDKELDIVWKLYVELNTRKAAIPFDEENDVIEEIYNSWYELFISTRMYLKELPGKELIGNESTRKIVKLSIDVLNKGLRPHLTVWQGKFRRWYRNALKEDANNKKTPQEIQKEYPEYQELISDIKRINEGLRTYSDNLGEILEIMKEN